ncbi:MAG: hypothetical protein DWH78_04915, partial [Planctomycetota bacterium]
MFAACGFAGCLILIQANVTHASQNQSEGKPKPATEDKPAAVQPVPDNGPADAARKSLPPLPEKLAEQVKDATALNPESTVYLDLSQKRLLLRTEVACPDCLLEMLLVPEGNREHETILRIRSKAFIIHTGLLALGMEPGKPAQFSPE